MAIYLQRTKASCKKGHLCIKVIGQLIYEIKGANIVATFGPIIWRLAYFEVLWLVACLQWHHFQEWPKMKMFNSTIFFFAFLLNGDQLLQEEFASRGANSLSVVQS